MYSVLATGLSEKQKDIAYAAKEPTFNRDVVKKMDTYSEWNNHIRLSWGAIFKKRKPHSLDKSGKISEERWYGPDFTKRNLSWPNVPETVGEDIAKEATGQKAKSYEKRGVLGKLTSSCMGSIWGKKY